MLVDVCRAMCESVRVQKNGITFLWGISGCGKKTIGRLLANRMAVPFVDGDALLARSDARLMFGEDLTDIRVTSGLLIQILNVLGPDAASAVVALSCLTKKSRDLLRGSLRIPARFMFLDCNVELARQRLVARQGKLTSNEELQDQFELCKDAEDSLIVDGRGSSTEVLSRANLVLGLGNSLPPSRL